MFHYFFMHVIYISIACLGFEFVFRIKICVYHCVNSCFKLSELWKVSSFLCDATHIIILLVTAISVSLTPKIWNKLNLEKRNSSWILQMIYYVSYSTRMRYNFITIIQHRWIKYWNSLFILTTWCSFANSLLVLPTLDVILISWRYILKMWLATLENLFTCFIISSWVLSKAFIFFPLYFSASCASVYPVAIFINRSLCIW